MTALDEAKKLISIPSVTGNEADIAEYLGTRFYKMGCRIEYFSAGPGRPNIYAQVEGSDPSRPALLFHGHTDTVPAYGMKNPYNPEIRDGKLYGRGSVDQKGGIAAVIEAFQSALSRGKPKRSFAFVGVIDEESEHRGSMALKAMGLDADFGIITEPSGLRLGIGCKGTAPILLEVSGRAAHGCRPWLGKNAVLAGMEAVRMMMDEPLPVSDYKGIGKISASLNLGKIEGGNAYNIVADRCRIWFDRRLIPGETQEMVLESISRILDQLPDDDGISMKFEIARPDWNWEPIKKRGLLPAMTPLSSSLPEIIKQIHRDEAGRDPEVFFTDGYHEMDFLVNELGMDTIHYGPGDSSLCHTDDENLDIFQLEQCSRVYRNLITRLCY